MTKPIVQTIQSHTKELRFLLLFTGFYCLFHFLYYQIPDAVLKNVVYHYGIAQVSAWLINFLSITEHVHVVQHKLISSQASLEIVRGCDGSGLLFILSAAMLAFPGKWRLRILGALIAIGMTYVFNSLRILLLYYVVAYESQWFTLVHSFLAPTFLIVVATLFFSGWIVMQSEKSVLPIEENSQDGQNHE